MNSSIFSVLHTVSAVDTDQAFYNGSRISDEHGWAVDENGVEPPGKEGHGTDYFSLEIESVMRHKPDLFRRWAVSRLKSKKQIEIYAKTGVSPRSHVERWGDELVDKVKLLSGKPQRKAWEDATRHLVEFAERHPNDSVLQAAFLRSVDGLPGWPGAPRSVDVKVRHMLHMADRLSGAGYAKVAMAWRNAVVSQALVIMETGSDGDNCESVLSIVLQRTALALFLDPSGVEGFDSLFRTCCTALSVSNWSDPDSLQRTAFEALLPMAQAAGCIEEARMLNGRPGWKGAWETALMGSKDALVPFPGVSNAHPTQLPGTLLRLAGLRDAEDRQRQFGRWFEDMSRPCSTAPQATNIVWAVAEQFKCGQFRLSPEQRAALELVAQRSLPFSAEMRECRVSPGTSDSGLERRQTEQGDGQAHSYAVERGPVLRFLGKKTASGDTDLRAWAVDKLEDVCAGDLAALWDEKAKFDDQIMAPLRSSLTQWITREAFDKAWAIFAGRPLLDTREFIEQFATALYPA